ncbi:uncharacterized protein MONOS_16025 [Monocercomonoides exilis]|uniref:uncharacterized protein n=1 Tax=Monocercomonoides exilis TaxID=2049356 RepID=UPI00355A0564|nr:hypothetical protein MONOS_16025 [Monocercomonoides exilis]|eukprot:MONOS_16025.1-p1 / transcript=MONOS_16025.1 / gene=MONOS_16025 / organism=Monocercomonoides_exilis_PA203 / gene_product=unspecified product / transcript_product=unspecified product / location=Mono_scaffold01464:589-837(+) / protein_length=83 / sequence_SO=supercontig / SO=protein_coding / is_pseudo=false
MACSRQCGAEPMSASLPVLGGAQHPTPVAEVRRMLVPTSFPGAAAVEAQALRVLLHRLTAPLRKFWWGIWSRLVNGCSTLDE